jgi:hypothetical protein
MSARSTPSSWRWCRASGGASLSPTEARRHIYFRWPRGPVRSSGAIAPGIEVIADCGACNRPPSAKAGGPYRWSLARSPDLTGRENHRRGAASPPPETHCCGGGAPVPAG